ncbi:outer membrane beta-barrel protein [Paraglaciecola sp.]|uniref:outer membrane beta-barrel protein n=1 Tax=Paraglaciecola sp. TaxID=1920173 RepID=UPI003264AAAF
MLNCSVFSQEVGFDTNAKVTYLHDSNIFKTNNSVGDSILSVEPTVGYVNSDGVSKLQASYQGSYSYFKEYSDLSFSEHNIFLKHSLVHSYAFSSEINLNYLSEIELPEENNALAIQVSEFTQRSGFDISAKLLYGTVNSTGQLIASYVHQELEYDNNGQEFRSYKKDSLDGTFLYRISPVTRLLLETGQSKLKSTNNLIIDRSSTDSIYLAGVEWSLTDTTTNSFKVGYEKVNYDIESLVDLSALSYNLDMNWKPSTYSLLKLGASRSVRESAVQSIGGFIGTDYNIGLEYDFTNDIKFNVNYSFAKSDFDDSLARKDEVQTYSAQLSYKLNYWLQLIAEGIVNKRSSSFEIYNYDASILGLSVSVSFD